MRENSVIVTRGLRKSYRRSTVLDGVDIDVGRGEIFALLGPNGAGKTTTVNILTTLIKPDAGTASIAGHDVLREPARVRSALSLTGQFAAVDPFQTGIENLRMMARLAHLRGRTAAARIDELVDTFDLSGSASRRASTYSGGMRRRLDLAISLLSTPPVVFLDEPTTGLDPRSRNQVWKVVRELADRGVTILLTTQYLEEADNLADTIGVIDRGVIVARGTAQSLKSGLDGDHVELTFDGDDSFRLAAALPFDHRARFDPERSTVTVPTRDAVATTRDLIALCDAHALRITNISFVAPTLDDVFLALTSTEQDDAA